MHRGGSVKDQGSGNRDQGPGTDLVILIPNPQSPIRNPNAVITDH